MIGSAKQHTRIFLNLYDYSSVGDLIEFSTHANSLIDHYEMLGRGVLLMLFVSNRATAETILGTLIQKQKVRIYGCAPCEPWLLKNKLIKHLRLLACRLNIEKRGYHAFIIYGTPRKVIDKIASKIRVFYKDIGIFAKEKRIVIDSSKLASLSHIQPKVHPVKTIGLYITSSSIKRSWSAENWTRLITYISNQYCDSYKIAAYGYGNEASELYETITGKLKQSKSTNHIHLQSYINANKFEDDISHCMGLEACITNDSGFMWLANMCNKKVVSILGYSDGVRYSKFFKTNLNQWKISTSSLPCSPCEHHHSVCPNMSLSDHILQQDCMIEDRAKEVFQKLKSLL
jgi:hypothetical protein